MNKYKIIGVVSCIVLIFLSGCIQPEPSYERITIIGETAVNGIYDPSVEYDQNGIGWMAYSAIDFPEYVHTHLAKSTDQGKTWTYMTTINKAINGTILYNNTEILGVWRHEVSTLVHDPGDPGKEWKLFWHKYFTIPPYDTNDRLFHFGWIAYKYAPHPTGPWSEEIPLFGAGSYPLGPFETFINLSSLDEDIHDLIVYSEPGSIVVDDIIYLSITGHVMKNDENIAQVILLSSEDHGETWEYVNTLLENKDAIEFGGLYFSGSSLAMENNTIYLLACPVDTSKPLEQHYGTCIYPFEDISTGELQRDGNGSLLLEKYLEKTLINGGQSDYDEHNTYGGIIMPQLNMSALPESFQIYNTKETIKN